MKGQKITKMRRDECGGGRRVTTVSILVTRQLLIIERVTQLAIINFHFNKFADNSAVLQQRRRQIYNILKEEFRVGCKKPATTFFCVFQNDDDFLSFMLFAATRRFGNEGKTFDLFVTSIFLFENLLNK